MCDIARISCSFFSTSLVILVLFNARQVRSFSSFSYWYVNCDYFVLCPCFLFFLTPLARIASSSLVYTFPLLFYWFFLCFFCTVIILHIYSLFIIIIIIIIEFFASGSCPDVRTFLTIFLLFMIDFSCIVLP